MCPVYGFGAVLNAIFLTDLKSAPVFLAIGGAVLSSFLVVVTGVVLEHIFHRKWWDYMADIMETNPDNSPVSIDLVPVFHLD